MEVADQWRREWAGTAEFGKVVEGGVTRQIARAMEVLNASGPGARVRVMRAAYHSSAGPGLPASSYMVHSSRRVISSGFNFMDTPSLPSKPLEISSIPFELSQDTDTENYKVTEPDDLEISEPSKWKSSLSGNSLRMPSEESSSTDNASIIDLDPRPHKPFLRKQSYDSENSDIPFSSGRTSRTSPLLDAPVTLSTLKFKSLLNGNNDWINRRKSYSFEDTSPLTETMLHSNETLAMESSTDSGICKSTEIVNENTDDTVNSKYFKDSDMPNNNFQSWLSNNKQNSYYKGTKFKNTMEHNIVIEEPAQNNITLQSNGKVSITLPIAIETENGYVYRNNEEDNNRKVKKVEFCKTELHFATDTGKVNIISTDDKPPPSNDFRKRRSAFVPLRVEKPVTLFGEKVNEYSDISKESLYTFSEYNESDENTAATKSILKNKIPKPKPYLLGENMAFGTRNDEVYEDSTNSINVPTAVSLINKQLHPSTNDSISPKPARRTVTSTSQNTFRTINEGSNDISSSQDMYGYRRERIQKTLRTYDEDNTVNQMKNIQAIKRSPTPGRIKTRELRESDLTYFGVNNAKLHTNNSLKSTKTKQTNNVNNDIFQSVRLIKQVSNSVCNSESGDTPEYQNIPFNNNFIPTPTPRQRTRFDDKSNQIEEIKNLKPVKEYERESKYDDMTISRRSKLRRQEEVNSLKNRSRSEPRKSYVANSIERPNRKIDQPTRSTENTIKSNVTRKNLKTVIKEKAGSDSEPPIYENINDIIKNKTEETNSITRPKNGSVKTKHENNRKVTTKIDQDDKKNTNSRTLKSDDSNYTTLQMINGENNHGFKGKTEKSDLLHKKSKHENSDSLKQIHNSLDQRKTNSNSTERKEHKSRSTKKENNGDIVKHNEKEPVSLQRRKESTDKKNIDSENKTDLKYRKSQQNKENSNTDSLKIIPKVVPNLKNKSMGNKDHSRPGSRSKRSEYVINYDDKNGTVSSVTKIRSSSGSPRRKPNKDLIRDKYKDSLNKNIADKVALLQLEDHQRNAGSPSGDKKWKSKVYTQRSCQVL